MKQITKRLFCLAATAVLLVGTVFAADVPGPPSNSYVLDQANVLSDQTEQTVNDYTAKLSQANGAQIGVLTVEFTGNTSIDDYALQVFKQWKIGDSSKNNGVLLLLVTGDDNYYCTLGTGLEGQITYSDLKRMLNDTVEPSFAKGDYDTAVTDFTQEMYNELIALYGTDGNQTNKEDRPVQSSGSDAFGIIFLILVIIAFIILFSSFGGKGGGGNGGGRRRDVFFFPLFFGGPRYPRNYPPFGGGFGGWGGGPFGGGLGGGGGFGGGGGGFGGFGGGDSRGGGAGRG